MKRRTAWWKNTRVQGQSLTSCVYRCAFRVLRTWLLLSFVTHPVPSCAFPLESSTPTKECPPNVCRFFPRIELDFNDRNHPCFIVFRFFRFPGFDKSTGSLTEELVFPWNCGTWPGRASARSIRDGTRRRAGAALAFLRMGFRLELWFPLVCWGSGLLLVSAGYFFLLEWFRFPLIVFGWSCG